MDELTDLILKTNIATVLKELYKQDFFFGAFLDDPYLAEHFYRKIEVQGEVTQIKRLELGNKEHSDSAVYNQIVQKGLAFYNITIMSEEKQSYNVKVIAKDQIESDKGTHQTITFDLYDEEAIDSSGQLSVKDNIVVHAHKMYTAFGAEEFIAGLNPNILFDNLKKLADDKEPYAALSLKKITDPKRSLQLIYLLISESGVDNYHNELLSTGRSMVKDWKSLNKEFNLQLNLN